MQDFVPNRRKRRFDDDVPDVPATTRGPRQRPDRNTADDDAVDNLPAGDRWSTWDLSTKGGRGPAPHPAWLVTELAAVDTDFGVLKTGKEADVHLLERGVPGTDRSCLLASKRYRGSEHRMFHRDAGYLEGRRVRKSREMRAMARRTAVGRQFAAVQWARAEFDALCRLHTAAVPVPYPVQLVQTELLLEFVGDPDGTAAPRLAQVADADPLELWHQLVDALVRLARLGLAHGDLSPYNVLVHQGRLVLIDLPQVVDVVTNPQGADFLARDAAVVATWFRSRGVPDTGSLPELLAREAKLR